MKPRNATAWQDAHLPKYPQITESASYDVVVIGGGITGLTAAYLLKRAGHTVCVLERGRLANGDTGLTTAHLTYVTDERLTPLTKSFGEQGARLAWQGGAAAINTIEEIARQEQIDCQFRRVPGFLHASLRGERNESDELRREAELASELGFAADFSEEVPYFETPGIRFADQAKFHPLEYLAGLARQIEGDGCVIFEQSDVEEVTASPLGVSARGHRLKCGQVVIATHVPVIGKSGLLGATLFQTKLAPYSSYVLGAHVERGLLPEASFWDTGNPYYYLRTDRGEPDQAASQELDYLIFGGEDHKTGQEPDTEQPFARLETMLRRVLPEAKVERRWSGQVVETHDGLPFIGPTSKGQFVATGYGGNGMTFGTLAGMMACDAVCGRENPWSDLFAPSRKPLRSGAWDYVTENIDYPYYLLKDRLQSAEGSTTKQVGRGEGKILKLDGGRVACSRDEEGKLSMVSAACTHMGCLVHWNQAERTWDCPCHGSRFKATGEVMSGPAESPLEPVDSRGKPREPSTVSS